jgi:hypothetical protein
MTGPERKEAPMQDPDTTLVALSPADMVPAQADLLTWCDRKLQALEVEAAELDLQNKLAIENGWKTSVVVNNLNRTARRITYYGKIKAALQAGYLLVPNMPIDVLAVRVKRTKPPEQRADSSWHHFTAKPQQLPAGEGRYVDETLTEQQVPYTTEENGKEVRKTLYVSDEFDEVDFPMHVMKPVILEAAARAMALRIFDQIGVVQNERSGDPILVGQLLDPRGNRRRTTFFIAWWIDVRTL